MMGRYGEGGYGEGGYGGFQLLNRVRFLYDNDAFDACTLSASSQEANLPVENLKDPRRKKVCRTTSHLNQWFRMNMGTEKAVADCIGLVNHNLTADGQVKLTATDNPDFITDLILDTGFVNIWEETGKDQPVHIISFGPVEAHYWSLYFLDSNNPYGYIELGRPILTRYLQLKRNFLYGWPFLPKDRSRTKYTEGGQPIVYVESKYYELELQFKLVSDVEKWTLVDMVRRFSVRKDFIVQLFPAENGKRKLHTTLYGRLKEPPRFVEDFYEGNSFVLKFMESQ